jgi:hypothetical protein
VSVICKTVNSSHGTLVIDADGNVVKGSVYDDDELKNIVRFDLEEYRKQYPDEPEPSSYDILDLGYWTDQGKYEPPDEDWRSARKVESAIKTYYFKVELVGKGATMEEAWEDALDAWDQRDSIAEDHFTGVVEEDE